MKKPFQIGERIVGYRATDALKRRVVGRITSIDSIGDIKMDDTWFHPNACRHLKPTTPRRRVFITAMSYERLNTTGYLTSGVTTTRVFGTDIEFVEVRKKT